MLKRLLSVAIALLGAFLAIVIYWLVFMPWYTTPGGPWVKLILAGAELVITIYLFARWRSWPALLLLVGSIPMVLVNIFFCGWLWRMNHGGWEPGVSPSLAFLFPSDNENSPINAILHYLIYLSILCLPIAFFMYFFRRVDVCLTKQ
jgi:hypothetical protein